MRIQWSNDDGIPGYHRCPGSKKRSQKHAIIMARQTMTGTATHVAHVPPAHQIGIIAPPSSQSASRIAQAVSQQGGQYNLYRLPKFLLKNVFVLCIPVPGYQYQGMHRYPGIPRYRICTLYSKLETSQRRSSRFRTSLHEINHHSPPPPPTCNTSSAFILKKCPTFC